MVLFMWVVMKHWIYSSTPVFQADQGPNFPTGKFEAQKGDPWKMDSDLGQLLVRNIYSAWPHEVQMSLPYTARNPQSVKDFIT